MSYRPKAIVLYNIMFSVSFKILRKVCVNCVNINLKHLYLNLFYIFCTIHLNISIFNQTNDTILYIQHIYQSHNGNF